MVNYAWAGRSQRKLWWRPVAVLTCKSVVRPGYRGERLIEPSSSWFPPKFPSGKLVCKLVLPGKANDWRNRSCNNFDLLSNLKRVRNSLLLE